MRRFVWTAATLAVVALMPGCNRKMKISHLPYPDTRRDTTVVDDYHGTRVADPYRWLEDDNSAETAAWVEAENAVTRDYLDRLPARQAIYDRLTALYDYPKEGAPERHGDYYYYFLNDGLQNQSALWRKRSLTAQGELFLDPNTLSADGTTALVLRRRPLVRVCRRRSRFGLGADTCRGYRDGSVDAGCDRMGEVLRRDMGPRLRRVLL